MLVALQWINQDAPESERLYEGYSGKVCWVPVDNVQLQWPKLLHISRSVIKSWRPISEVIKPLFIRLSKHYMGGKDKKLANVESSDINYAITAVIKLLS